MIPAALSLDRWYRARVGGRRAQNKDSYQRPDLLTAGIARGLAGGARNLHPDRASTQESHADHHRFPREQQHGARHPGAGGSAPQHHPGQSPGDGGGALEAAACERHQNRESYRRRVASDEIYFRRWNFGLDLAILLGTIRVAIKSERD